VDSCGYITSSSAFNFSKKVSQFQLHITYIKRTMVPPNEVAPEAADSMAQPVAGARLRGHPTHSARERESVCVFKGPQPVVLHRFFRKVAKYSDPSDGRILLFWWSFGFRSDGVEGGLNSHGMKELYVHTSVRSSFFLSFCLFVRPSILPSIRPSFRH